MARLKNEAMTMILYREVIFMGKPFLLVSSITYAMKGREILSRHGFRVYVERISRRQEQHGCGYGLYVPQGADEAEKILQQFGVRVLSRMEWGGSR